MSIQTQIEGLAGDISSAYDAVEEMGGTVPEESGSANLPGAIRGIPIGVSEERLQQTLSAKLEIGPNRVDIPRNADLNDYLTCGCYRCRTNLDAETVVNLPRKAAFILDVCSNISAISSFSNDTTGYYYFIQLVTDLYGNQWYRSITKEASNPIQYNKWQRIIPESVVNERTQLALQSACPTNHIIYDDLGNPSVYVYIPKFRLCDVMSTSDTRVHPAFIVNGQEIPGIYIGKFQSSVSNGRAYSLPAKDPTANVNLDTVVSQNRTKGGNFHEITAAEWSAIALWCHKNGTEPKGNNNYGKDVSETLYKAAPTSYNDGKTERVATGTGPVTWSHDRTLEGIWDMNSNVLEWCAGMRLVHGELQVIPNNDAADPTCDLSSISTAWKAINAADTSFEDLFVTPDGNGTTQGSVKLDWDGTKWVYSTIITHETKAVGCSFASVTADTSIGDQAKLMLMALAMMPDLALTGDDIAADYNGDYFWINNIAEERCLIRGGDFSTGARAGVFCLNLYDARSDHSKFHGGRSAFIN